ncbi:putative wall-associated receptor kinase, galacturonan-binding domain-containing protein [Helianthus debilis subsp. tardiflorus]
MKFLVLICAVSVTFAFTTSNGETRDLIHSTNLIKPGCESRCGNLIVPYPFGIGLDSNCSIGIKGFDIHCNKSVDPPKATFTGKDYNSIKLISDSTLRTSNLVARKCSFLDNSRRSTNVSFDFRLWPAYTFSEVNRFTVIGCDGYAWLTSATKNRNVSTGCMVFCSRPGRW